MEKRRASIIDGTIEEVSHPKLPKPDKLVPIFGTKKVVIQTVFGPEEIEQKYIIGFIEKERKI